VEWVETTGQDIDEAKERALDELGVDADEAEFEIVEEAKAGLFGLVRKEARVRARIRPTQPRPKVERRRGRGRGGNGRGQRDADTAGSSPAEATPAPERAPGDRGEGGRQRSGGSRRRGSGKGKGSRTSTGTASVRTETSDGEEPMDEVSVDQQVEVIEDFLEGLVEAFGLEGEIANERVEDEIVEIQVEGDDLGLLIGPKGQTLAAIGELGRTVVCPVRTRAGSGSTWPGTASAGPRRSPASPSRWQTTSRRTGCPRSSSRCRPSTARSSTTR
jgi:spoIIIJ-associated protein